jgi:nucleotide-binding universal stress UspA family protein
VGISPITKAALADMGSAMKDPALRFWAVEHATMMILALGLVHMGRARVKKSVGLAKHKAALIFFGLALLFVVLGTDEATYLSIYAAGVFVLLSMTGWAAVLRLHRRRRVGARVGPVTFASVTAAAVFTSLATVVLFYERFGDGVWLYGLLVPVLAFGFAAVRRQRGDPGALADRMGMLVSNQGPGSTGQISFGDEPHADDLAAAVEHLEGLGSDPCRLPTALVYRVAGPGALPWRVCVPLDGSVLAELALPYAAALGRVRPLDIDLLHVREPEGDGPGSEYLEVVRAWLADHVNSVACHVVHGEPADSVLAHVERADVNLLLMSTHGHSGVRRAIAGSVTRQLLDRTNCAVLVVTCVEVAPPR